MKTTIAARLRAMGTTLLSIFEPAMMRASKGGAVIIYSNCHGWHYAMYVEDERAPNERT